MFRILFGILMFILMPFRVLFLISIALNIVLLFSINAFVSHDTYLYYQNRLETVKANASEVLQKSCVLSATCSLKLYAVGELQGKDELKEFFSKTLNNNNYTKKIQYKDFFKEMPSPITELFEELDLSFQVSDLKTNIQSCGKENEGTVVCRDGGLVMVFTAQDCNSCVKNFKNNFTDIEKNTDQNILIQFSSDANNIILNLFKDNNKNNFFTKIKAKINDIVS